MSGMLPRRWFEIPLARKLSLFFGAAVLSTIGVTLAFPWLQMNALNDQAELMRAERVAIAAYQCVDLRARDWHMAQVQLTKAWPGVRRQLGIGAEAPVLVPVAPGMTGAPRGTGFRADAAEYLLENPDRGVYWRTQDRGRVFRLAMAVRGLPADPHPGLLYGFIDVTIPVTQHGGAWNTMVTLLAGASGSVLAVLMFYLTTRRLVLDPVTTLRRVAERVTHGDLAAQAQLVTGDEFQQLAEALNEMLTHLANARVNLEKINRSLDVRVNELSEINVTLHESNRLRNDFLANVSHELRTPLVSIIGFAELLRDAWDNPAADRNRLRRYSENILASGRSLLELINDLLDLAKIEAGKMSLHRTEFSIAQLANDMVDFVRPLADKRDQQLTLEIHEPPTSMNSDAGKIKQILYNLLSNAIKFTPTGGSMQLEVDGRTEQGVVLRVRDTGPGIPKEKQAGIFEKFSQLDSSRTREHAGTGLGLAITRDLVHLLGGAITVDSEEGQGAAFTVRLPLAAPQWSEKRG